MQPLLILTRPEPASRRFLRQIEDHLGRRVDALIAPLMRIDPVPFVIKGPVSGLIFTSENGVAQAAQRPFPPGLPAYCVGDQTAAKARDAGFQAISANGDSDALVRMLVDQRPRTPLVHLHGVDTRGDIADRLNKAGLPCASITCYAQTAIPFSPEARAAFGGSRPLIVPLFSPRSATMLVKAVPLPHARLTVIAISSAVAEAAKSIATAGLILAKSPNGRAVLAATCRHLAPC